MLNSIHISLLFLMKNIDYLKFCFIGDMMIKKFTGILKNLFNKHDKEKSLIIGSYTYGKPKIYRWNKYKVVIGKFCSISQNVQIIVDGNHRTDWITTFPFGKMIKDAPIIEGHPFGKGDIIIGNDVWIGLDVIILPGVNVGDGAVIGAGSVVTKNVDDYEIIAGNPAKHIRYRFNEETIQSLKKIKWWNWPIDKIMDNLEFLQSENIDKFIEKYG